VGDVKLWGTDLSAEFAATDYLSFSGSYSWVNQNFFAASGSGEADLSTNTPRNKGLLAARFRQSSRDLSVEFRGRYVDGFRMVDGVWNGNVDAFTVADLEAGIAIPDVRSARFTVTVQNLADRRHSEFVAAPILGRLLLTRLQYQF